MCRCSSALGRPRTQSLGGSPGIWHLLARVRPRVGMGQAAGMTRVAILAPMKQELAAVVKAMSLETGQVGDVTMKVGRVGDTEVVATTTGMGMDLARSRTEALLD